MRKYKHAATFALFTYIEIDAYRRLIPYHTGEYLVANFLFCLLAFWFAWEVLGYERV